MTDEEKKEIFWTYLHGKKFASEFPEHLPVVTEEKNSYSDEVPLEQAWKEILKRPVSCPTSTWELALSKVQTHRNTLRKKNFIKKMIWLSVPMAAMLVLFFYTMAIQHETLETPKLSDIEHIIFTASEFNPPSVTTIGEVRAFLEQMALPVALDPSDDFDGVHSPYRIVGARADSYFDEQLIQLFFECDGMPAGLLIVKNGGLAAREIGNAVADGTVGATRSVGGVLVATLGTGAPHKLIHIVNDNWPELQPSVESTVEPTEAVYELAEGENNPEPSFEVL